MSSVDKRIVQLDFDNAKFEQKASMTLRTLEDMKKGFQFKDASTGLEGISAKAGSVNLSPLLTAAETVNRRFSVMGTFTSRIIENIADSAYEAGKKIAGYLAAPVTKAVNQIKTGGWNRAANLEQAKFTMENLGEDWEKWKDSINKGVAGTAFGLDQGAMLASKLIASGLKDTKDMEMALLATAGTASTFSADYERVGDILQDCISKGVAMGGEFQRLSEIGVPAAEILAEKWGVTSAEIQDMASKRQIDGMQLVAALFDKFGDSADKANKTYTGALANLNAGLSKIGELLATPLREHMRDLFNTLRVAVNTVKDLLGPIVNVVTDKMDKVFTWIIEKLGGPDEEAIRRKWSKIETALANVADALENLWNAAMSVITPIAEAFKEVFPPATIWGLTRGTKKFADLTETLIASEGTQKKIKNVFLAIFGAIRKVRGIAKKIISFIKPALKTAWSWLGKIFTTVTDLIASVQQGGFAALFENIKSMFDGAGKAAGEAGKGLLSFLDTVPSFKQAIGIFKKFGETIKDIAPTLAKVVLAVPYGISKLLGFLIDTFAPMLGTDFSILWTDIKDGFSQLISFITGETKSIDAAGILGKIGQDALNVLSDIGAAAIKAVTSFWEWLQNLPIDWKAVGKTISDIVGGILTGIATAISSITIDFSPILDTITNNPVVKAVATFFDQLFQATNSIKKTNKMQKAAMDGGAMMKGTAEQVADDTQDSIGILETILNGLTVAKDGALTVLLAALARVAWGVGKIVSQTGGVIKGVKKIFYSVAKENRAVARSINANALIKVAVAIGIFAAAIFALCMLPIAKVQTVGGILLSFAGILAVVMAVLSVKKKADSLGFLEKLGYKIDKFFDFVKKLSAIGILVAGIGVGLYLIVKTIMMVAKIDWKKTWGAAVGVAGMLIAIGVLAGVLAKAAPDLDEGTAWTIIAIGAAIRIMVGAIKSLGKMLKVDKNGNIKGSSVWQLIAGVGGVALLLLAIGKMAKIAEKNDIQGAGKAILAMSVGIYILVRAVKTISSLPFWPAVGGLLAVIGLLATFTLVAKTLAKNDIDALEQIGKLAAGMALFAGAIYALGLAFSSVLKAMGPVGGWTGLIGMAVYVVAFTAIMAGIAYKAGDNTAMTLIKLAGGMLIFAAALGVMAGIVYAASLIDWMQVVGGVINLATAIGALALIAMALNAGPAEAMGAAGLAMLPFAGACLAIALAVWLVTDALQRWGIDLEGIVEHIVGLFENLASRAKQAIEDLKYCWDVLSGKDVDPQDYWDAYNKAVEDNQRSIDLGLGPMYTDEQLELLKKNAEEQGGEIGKSLVGGVVVGMGSVKSELDKAAKDSDDYVVDRLKHHAGINSPSKVTEEDVGKPMGIGEVIGLITSLQSGEKDISDVASALGVTLSSSLLEGADMEGTGSDILSSLFSTVADGKDGVSALASVLGGAMQTEFGDTFDISNATESEFNEVWEYLSNNFDGFADLFGDAGGTWGQALKDNFVKGASGEDMVTDVADTVTGQIYQFEQVSDDITSTMADSFEAGGPLLQSAALTDVDYIQDGLIGDDAISKITGGTNTLVNSAITAIDNKNTDFYNAGVNAAEGFRLGLVSKTPDIAMTGGNIAMAFLSATDNTLAINSPSKEMEERGELSAQGFLIGLTKNSDKLTSEAGEMATGVLAALSTITLDDTNLNPTITPIMDLSNIQNGADAINGMFADTQATLNVGGIQGDIFGSNLRNLAALAGSMSMDRGSGSADVVNAIAALQDEVATMGEKMSKLQVRMDSGALVGQIAAPLDASLGRIARRRERSG